MATSANTNPSQPSPLPSPLPSPPYPDSRPSSPSPSQAPSQSPALPSPTPSPTPSQPQTKTASQSQSQPQPQPQPQSQSQSKPRSRTQSTQSPPQPQPQPQQQQQSDPQPQPQPQPESESEPEPEPEPEPKPKPEKKPEQKPTPKPEQDPEPKPEPQPQPQPQPQSRAQFKPKKPRVDGKAYYGYLYNADKSPTDILNALLRSIGQYIVDNIGDPNDKQLNPKKLSAFYHVVGGDYDSFFLKSPNKSISYVWRALGVQHTLQPTDNDYEEPSIPALTLRGFVRWQSLQILLDPEEHVPFIQYALANWGLKHPDTGEPFPVDLPAESLPTECDAEIDRWHKTCGERLRSEATPKEESPPPPPPKPPSPEPRRHTSYSSQPRGPQAPRPRPDPGYFPPQRPVSYIHVTEARYAAPRRPPNHSSDKHHVSNSSGSSSDEDMPRRRSYPDMRSHPRAEDVRPSGHSDPHRAQAPAPAPAPRRHSNQRSYSPSSTDSETGSDISPPRSSKSSRPYHHVSSQPPPPPSVRRVPVGSHTPPSAVPMRPRREIRTDDHHRMSFPAEIKQRLSSMFPGSSDRRRSNSREKNHAPMAPPPGIRFTKGANPTRLTRSASGDSYPSDESELDISRYAARRQREHARALGKERERDLELEEERERRSRKERGPYLRPAIHRRTSSHADAERRVRENGWDPRDRERSREWERDREGRRMMNSADERDVRRVINPAEERERRDRRRYNDREPGPVMTGVTGRRYPGRQGVL